MSPKPLFFRLTPTRTDGDILRMTGKGTSGAVVRSVRGGGGLRDITPGAVGCGTGSTGRHGAPAVGEVGAPRDRELWSQAAVAAPRRAGGGGAQRHGQGHSHT